MAKRQVYGIEYDEETHTFIRMWDDAMLAARKAHPEWIWIDLPVNGDDTPKADVICPRDEEPGIERRYGRGLEDCRELIDAAKEVPATMEEVAALAERLVMLNRPDWKGWTGYGACADESTVAVDCYGGRWFRYRDTTGATLWYEPLFDPTADG